MSGGDYRGAWVAAVETPNLLLLRRHLGAAGCAAAAAEWLRGALRGDSTLEGPSVASIAQVLVEPLVGL